MNTIFTKAINIDFSGLLKLGNFSYTVDQLNKALHNTGINTGYSNIIYCDELPSTLEVELNTIYVCNDALNIYTGSKWISSNNVSNLANIAYSGNYSDLNNKPELSTVATTGNYSDLNNKPELSTIAITGNYSDLNNKPELSTVATTGNYSDLNNKPELSTVATTGSYNDLNNKPELSTVAITGNYNDLNNKPEIFSENRGILLEQKMEIIETTLGELEVLTDNILENMGIDNQQRSFTNILSSSKKSLEQNRVKKKKK